MADSGATDGPAESGSPSADAAPSGIGGWSDRILGLVALLIGIAYTVEARTFEVTAFGSGPVGPKTLPTGVGIFFCALAAYLIFKPDEGARWPNRQAAWQIGLVVLASYVYGRIMEPIGFILASAVMTIVIGLLFRAPPRRLLPLSIVFPVVLAFVFNNWLELQLPDGWWGGF